ncbi:hypothetical protein OUZ56_012348 [Daphnia magna]|uniref:Uncharacterized protein n=1 Tax=Daphnia magna TaxID=35525 RepID=A0ABQ9Z2W3_9CRUS|nr:hypothetical protein OUZ56_012348 [Daphnia magna]
MPNPAEVRVHFIVNKAQPPPKLSINKYFILNQFITLELNLRLTVYKASTKVEINQIELFTEI